MSDDLRIPPPGYRGGNPRDQETRRLIVMAGGICAVLLAVVVIWAVFSMGGGGAVTLVQADPDPVKTKPVDPGGLRIPGLSNQLLSEGDTNSATSLAPAPEAPDPAGLAAAAAKEQAPPPVVTLPSAEPGSGTLAQTGGTALPLPPPPAAVVVPSIPETPAKPGPKAKPVPPQPRNAAGVGNLALEMPQATRQAAKPSAQSARPGHVQVQLAALDSSEKAQAEWARLQHHLPALLSGRQPIVMQAEVGGRHFWRLRTAGFGSVGEAAHFCQQMKAAGATCAVAAF